MFRMPIVGQCSSYSFDHTPSRCGGDVANWWLFSQTSKYIFNIYIYIYLYIYNQLTYLPWSCGMPPTCCDHFSQFAVLCQSVTVDRLGLFVVPVLCRAVTVDRLGLLAF